jgi:hypothetical protein
MGRDFSLFRIGMWLGWGLGTMRTGTQRLGRMGMRTGMPGARDD